MEQYAASIGTVWVVGMFALAIAGMFLWHRREGAKAKGGLSGEREQLAAIGAQLADLQARVAKIEKVLASVD